MNELPKVADLDIPLTPEERYARLAAAQAGSQAVEAALFAQPSERELWVDIILSVNGREIRAASTPEVVARIMALLVGMP